MIHCFSVGKFKPLFFASFLSAGAYASELTLELDQQVVTGTRTSRVLLDTPVRTEVITRQDIERQHARNAREAINLLPGALIQKVHGKTGYEVWLQGVSADRVLVLIDGEPISASTGSSVDLTQIGTVNIDRIEVVKGATSALYGSNAIGGVINIITRQFTKPFSYMIQGDLGSYGTQNVDGKELADGQRSGAGLIALKQDGWYANGSFDFVDSDGFKAYEHIWDQSGPEGSKANGHLVFGLTPSENQSYFFGADYYGEETDYRFTQARPGNPNYKIKHENADRRTLKLGADWWLETAGEFKARLFSERFRNTTNQDSVDTPQLEQKRHAVIRSEKISTQWDIDASPSHNLTMGADYEAQSLSQYAWNQDLPGEKVFKQELIEPRVDRHNSEFFLQDAIIISDSLELLPGFRFQNDSDFGDYFAPKVNGRYDFAESVDGTRQFIRFGVGRGYRVPNLKERYFLFDHSQNGYVVYGNPDLVPESSKSYQLSWAITEPNLYYVDINLFLNKQKNLIATGVAEQPNESNDFISQHEYINIGRSKTQGAEFSSTLTPTDNFKYMFSYTYLESRDLRSKLHLNKRPRHQVKSNIDYQPNAGPFTISLLAQWQSKAWYNHEQNQQAVSWSRFDIKLNYDMTKHIKLYAGIDNIEDTQRDFSIEHDLRPDEGRFVYAGLKLTNF
ncbi:MAG: TonB-dependent receptor [Pseudomonadales bacterium]|nr:TonB-dependent receptor [Pseudomonadales bacterium]